jgi:hypothetical protein
MPIAGEIRKDYEIGKANKYENMIYLPCPDCNKERWVKLADTRKSNFTGLCQQCCLKRRNGKLENSPNWKGGIKYSGGYVFIYLSFDSPFYSMTNSFGYVKRSRLIMAQHLCRCLTPGEEVHHEDGIRSNDDWNNLKYFATKDDHQAYHRLKEISQKGLRPVDAIGHYNKGGYRCLQSRI